MDRTETRGQLRAALEKYGLCDHEAALKELGLRKTTDLAQLQADDLKTMGMPVLMARKCIRAIEEDLGKAARPTKLPDLPRFEDHMGTPLRHIMALSVTLAAHTVPKYQWSQALAQSLTPKYAVWAQHVLLEQDITWEEAKRAFLERFGSTDGQALIKQELAGCKQRGRSIEDYARDFEALSLLAGVPDDDEMTVILFREGMDERFRSLFFVHAGSEKKLSRCIAKLLEIPFPAPSRKLASVPSRGARRPEARLGAVTKQKFCKHHGQCSHETKDCRILQGKSNTRTSTSNSASWGSQGPGNRQDKKNKDVLCYKCQERGHYANECPSRKQQQKDRATRTLNSLESGGQPAGDGFDSWVMSRTKK